MPLARRDWVPAPCEDRVQTIATRTATRTPGTIAARIGALAQENRRIHDTECVNLNPATNVMNPRAEALLASGLGARPSLGYPGDKYETGLEAIEEIEVIAATLAAQVFGAPFAEIRVPSGAIANLMAFMATCRPDDTIIAPPAAIGGHVTHHAPGCAGLYGLRVAEAPVAADGYTVNVDALRALAHDARPRLITLGSSLNLAEHPVAEVRAIADEVGAYLMADIAHIAGLVAAGVHPSPFPHAHVVTTTTHKTLRGPRGGLVMTNDEELSKKINRSLFPGVQGGPLMHIIGAKAVAFGEALKPEFKSYSEQVVRNAQALASALQEHGFRITSGKTENHLMLVDLRARSEDLTGADAEGWLESAGIITNKNGVPNDPRPPRVTSGLRLGTPATTTRGMREPEMQRIAGWIDAVLESGGGEGVIERIRGEVRELCAAFALPGH